MQFLLWIIAIILSAAAGYWVYRADKRRNTPYPWLTASLRSIVVLLTLLLLFAPFITITNNETQKPLIVFLQDNSSSISSALGKGSVTYKQNAKKLLEKLSVNHQVIPRTLNDIVAEDSLFKYTLPATDISGALSNLKEYYAAQNIGAIILASDGKYNQGNNPLYQQLSLQCPVYTVGIGDSSMQKDLRIAQVYANKTATLNTNFEIRADIIATLCNGYNNTIQLSETSNEVASSVIAVNSNKYDRSVSFNIKAAKPGLHHYIITVPIAEGEINTANNRRDVYVEVIDEKKKILIAAAAPHPDINAIREALSETDNYDVTVRMSNELPSFASYDVIILHNLPSIYNNIQNDISRAKKPTWYILGGQTNSPALQNLPKPAELNINPAGHKDVYPALSLSFNSFTAPQNLQAVMDKMPPLNVPTGTIQALPDADVLFKQRDGEQTPLWLLRHSNIPTALTTGEGLWRWRIYEYKYFNNHNSIDECIRQTVAFLAANSNEKPFNVSLAKYVWNDQEAILLNAYLLNAANQQINSPEVQLTITDSSGNNQTFSFEHNGSNYKLNAGIYPAGNYSYVAKTTFNGTTYSAQGSFSVESTPLEQMETGADYNMLYSLANKYNGAFVPASNITALADSVSKNVTIKPVIQTRTQLVPLIDWQWYFVCILVFAVAEWLLRKYWLAQ